MEKLKQHLPTEYEITEGWINTKLPLVSIACTVYNHEDFLAETLNSLLIQKTNFPFEIIIHDDESNDGSTQIIGSYVERYPSIIFPIYQRENQYSKGNKPFINVIVPKCRGEYIAKCEGDDYWTDQFKLQTQIDFLENNKEYAACFHPVYWLENNEIKENLYTPILIKSSYDLNDVLENSLQITVCSTVFRKSSLTNIPASLLKVPYWDNVLHFLNAKKGNIGYINKPMATYRRHASGYYSGDSEFNRVIKTIETWKVIENEFGLSQSIPLMKRYAVLLKKLNGVINEESVKLNNIIENNSMIEVKPNIIENAKSGSDFIACFEKAQKSLSQMDFKSAENEIQNYRNNVDYNLFNLADNRDKNNPIVSVIIVAYNTNQLLIDCVNSLQIQSNNNFEIIIVDNGKNEKVEKEIREMSLLYVKSPTNLILSEGRNIGVHFAKGKIVAFLDDDAIADKDFVSTILAAFEKYNIVALRGKVLPKTNSENNVLAKHYNLGEIPIPSAIDTEGNSAFLKEKFLEVNGMNPLLFGGEGTDISYRLAKSNSLYCTIYSPNTIIYHDYASIDDKLESKTSRHRLMHSYMIHLHPDIFRYHASLAQFTMSSEAKEIGEGKIPRLSMRKENIFYSICIPTYNRAKLLKRSIESALKQTYSNYEIVVIDDGSTDNTEELVKSFGSNKINYKKLDHVGAPSARNEAVRTAKGEYILWLDSDDEMTSEMLTEYNNVLSSSDEYNIIYCNNTRVFDESGGMQEIKYTDINGKIAPEELLFGPLIANCGTLIKKSLIEEVGYYNEEFKRAHDFEFWARALPLASYKHVNKMLYYQHFHNQGNLSPIYHESTNLSYEVKIVNELIKNYSIDKMFPNVDWQKLDSQKKKEAKSLVYATYAEALNKWGDNIAAKEYITKSLNLIKMDGAIKLSDKINSELQWAEKEQLPITAIISAFNEGDIIYHVVKDFVDQDIQVYFLDNNSTDNTVDEVKKLLGKGVIKIEKFPQDANYNIPSDKYVWRYLLKRKEEISNELGKGWYIHADADEFREAPWKNLSLRKGIEKVNQEGYNAINFKIYDFKPIDDSFEEGKDVREYLKYYSDKIHPYNNYQIKAWKNFGQAINLWESGGHNIQFLGRKVFPMPFILRHYSIRSQAHGIKKIFNERKNRYDKAEREAQWHQHYDHIENKDYNLISEKLDLILYDRNKVCQEIQSGKYNFSEEVKEEELVKNKENNNDVYYEFPRPEVQALVDKNSKFILDIGCGGGRMASELKNNLGAILWGIEYMEEPAKRAATKLDKVIINKVEEAISQLPDKKFDSIIMADVLEHLENPYKVLEDLKSKLSDKGEIIISIPNVNHFTVFKKMLEGEWEYEDAGILDKTHLRFFTRKSVIRMLNNAGYQITEMKATSFGQFNLSQKSIDALKKDGLDTSRLNENLNHYQYLVKAVPIKTTKKTSIVVPVYNQMDYTKKFIDSVLKYTADQFEIIIVDNNSGEETINYLKELEKNENRVKVIYNTQNYGFPIAVNQGLKAAAGDYVVIVNNDIVVTEGWLDSMTRVAEINPQIGIVGPISNSVSGVQIDKEAKYNTIEEMHDYAKNVKIKNKNQIHEFPRVAFLCTLIKKEVVDKIGGLDERFSPGNFEDDDFCLRAQLAGYKTVIAKDVFIHHYGSVSFKANGVNDYAERLENNKKIFEAKWNANPDEIWLKGKNFKTRNITYPINESIFIEAFTRTLMHSEENDFELALTEAGRAIENFDSSDRTGYEKLTKSEIIVFTANIALQFGDLEKAQEYFQKELELNPDSAKACFGLAETFYAAELFEESKTMYEWAIKNGLNDNGIRQKLALVNSQLGLESSHNSLDLSTDEKLPTIEEAEELINSSDLSGAENILTTILNNTPNSVDAINDLAVVKIMQNKFEDALEIINKVIELDPQNEIAIENLNYLETHVTP